MPARPPEFVAIIIAFQPLFSKRVFCQATVLIIGAILAPGVRTVSSVQKPIYRTRPSESAPSYAEDYAEDYPGDEVYPEDEYDDEYADDAVAEAGAEK